VSNVGFEEIEHTADWAIRVRAANLPELFARAARGMFSLLTDLSGLTPEHSFDIELRAIDVETLLVDWLNELLYLAEQHDLVFAAFNIHELSIAGEARLRATVAGNRPAELFKVIKAATFSSLSIRHNADELEAELVFDV
jgi:SHS2 domain-containing protein